MGIRALTVKAVIIFISLAFVSCNISRGSEDDLNSRIAELNVLQSFSFPAEANGLGRDCIGVFNGQTIYVSMPVGTDLATPLIPEFSFLGERVTLASDDSVEVISGTTALDFSTTFPLDIDVWSRNGQNRSYTIYPAEQPESSIAFRFIDAGDLAGSVDDPQSRTNGPVFCNVTFSDPVFGPSLTAGDFEMVNSALDDKQEITPGLEYEFVIYGWETGPFSLQLPEGRVSEEQIGIGVEESNTLQLTWDFDPPYQAEGDYDISAPVITPETITLNWKPSFDDLAPDSSLEYKVVRCLGGFENEITGDNGAYLTGSTADYGVVQDWTAMPDNSATTLSVTDTGLAHHTWYSYNVYVQDDLGNWQEYWSYGYQTQLVGTIVIQLDAPIENAGPLYMAPSQQVMLDDHLIVSIDDGRNFSSISWYLDGYLVNSGSSSFDRVCSMANFNSLYASDPALPALPVIGPHILTCYVIDEEGSEHYSEIYFEVGYP